MDRHTRFWFPDGNIVFQAGETLFCLHRSILAMHSEAMETILSLPSGVANDGADDGHAILLEGISSEEFEYFAAWVYHVGSIAQQHSVPSLTAILKISRWLMIENSISWAIDRLEVLDLSPAHRLELARKYDIPQWIPRATQELISSPLGTINEKDLSHLDLRIYSIIAKAREVLERERKTIAAVPPGLSLDPDPDCPPNQHRYCRDTWARFWWQKVARQLLHPTNPLPFNTLIAYIAEQPHPEGLRTACKEQYIGDIIEGGGLDIEDNITSSAIVAIETYFASL